MANVPVYPVTIINGNGSRSVIVVSQSGNRRFSRVGRWPIAGSQSASRRACGRDLEGEGRLTAASRTYTQNRPSSERYKARRQCYASFDRRRGEEESEGRSGASLCDRRKMRQRKMSSAAGLRVQKHELIWFGAGQIIARNLWRTATETVCLRRRSCVTSTQARHSVSGKKAPKEIRHAFRPQALFS